MRKYKKNWVFFRRQSIRNWSITDLTFCKWSKDIVKFLFTIIVHTTLIFTATYRGKRVVAAHKVMMATSGYRTTGNMQARWGHKWRRFPVRTAGNRQPHGGRTWWRLPVRTTGNRQANGGRTWWRLPVRTIGNRQARGGRTWWRLPVRTTGNMPEETSD